ncbi:MAG: EamA family transporter [Candidatus Marsarchaeota archaeon]|jgi:drug/metabolite transporter (DMT)-like permease|nr:EamA family transporter [Candidatus Marsarchaeota archaeon]MCL5418860.1 EamA family transporter [Candidatus Marsarchaeota archaeon]
MNTYLVIFLTLFAALIASLAQLVFKKALKPSISFKEIVKLVADKYVLVGGVGYIAGLAIYLYALYNAPLSIVYPIFASTFIFIVIFSRLVLKERISGLRYLGIGIVFIGIIIISLTI